MAGRGIKIALPGYDAFQDTDPNHFSLFVDQLTDYVLIKEKTVAQVSVTGTSTIAHNLGYVPFCLVFAEVTSGVWRRVYSRAIDGTGAWFHVNDTNLILENSGGAQNFIYHIFYDDIASVIPTTVDIQGSHVAVAKIGKNAFSKDPNDFIFNSAFNTFKIVAEATKTVSLAASTNNQSFTEAHNQGFIPLVNAFAKESGKSQVFLPNSDDVDTWGSKAGWSSTGIRFNYVKADATNITFNFDNTTGGIVSVSIRYFVLEAII